MTVIPAHLLLFSEEKKRAPGALAPAKVEDSLQALPFEELYENYFSFVWRCLRAQGVDENTLDDAVQEVFIVVHRRRREFEGRCSPRTWLFAICHRVAANCRRRVKRKGGGEELTPYIASTAPTPIESAQRSQAATFVQNFAESLSDAKRSIFIMCLLEGMTVPEAAEALGVNTNTIYSRLRAVRVEFQRAAMTMRARQ